MSFLPPVRLAQIPLAVLLRVTFFRKTAALSPLFARQATRTGPALLLPPPPCSFMYNRLK